MLFWGATIGTMLDKVPSELCCEIASFLSPKDINNLRRVSKTFGVIQKHKKVTVESLHTEVDPEATSVIFGSYFNQELSLGVLPPSVTSVAFGSHFNQELSP